MENPGAERGWCCELAWDLLRENGGGWFSQYNVAPARERVTIVGGAIQSETPQQPAQWTTLAPVTVDELPQRAAGKQRAALTIWATRPLVGIGPTVFQYVYGPYLGMQRWDTRIHTNNLYLELLVGSQDGLAAFVSLIGAQIVLQSEHCASRAVVGCSSHSCAGRYWRVGWH